METTEKITFLYLRFNGFFLMPHFTVFGVKQERHVDVLSIRPAGCEEKVDDIILCRDDEFIDKLGGPDKDIAIWAEVGTRHVKDIFHPKKENYVKRIFGVHGNDLKKVYFNFEKINDETITTHGEVIEVPAGRCRKIILERFSQMDSDRILDLLGEMTKSGSWRWSEDFLADLLFLMRTGFLKSIIKY